MLTLVLYIQEKKHLPISWQHHDNFYFLLLRVIYFYFFMDMMIVHLIYIAACKIDGRFLEIGSGKH
jgi:hypothetical protein